MTDFRKKPDRLMKKPFKKADTARAATKIGSRAATKRTWLSAT